MEKIELIIERSLDSEVWGRVNYDDNLIVESAKNINGLQKKMKKLLFDFHSLIQDEIEFELKFDITGLFETKSYLKPNVIANIAGISPGLMRQYVSGIKYPSKERVEIIEATIHKVGKDLLNVRMAKPSRKGINTI